MNKIVSVVTPTYGRSEMLLSSIQSVLSQTHLDIECIVVDDNGLGTPNQIATQKVISHIEDQRLKYIPLDKNMGGSHARNVGAFASKGEYICFLDDDDIFLPTKVEQQLRILDDNPDFVGCYCNHIRKNHITGVTKEYKSDKYGDILKNILLFEIDVCSGSTLMVRRSIFDKLNGFTEGIRRFQDYEFLTRLCAEGGIGLAEAPLVIINTHEGSNCNRCFKRDEEDRLKYLSIIQPIVNQMSMKDRINVEYANNSYLLISAIKLLSISGIIKYLFKLGINRRTANLIFGKILRIINKI